MTTPVASLETPIRILIVEDHRLESDLLRWLLQKQPDLQVVGEAANREQALVLAASQQPDIILLDLQLKDDLSLNFLPELLAASQGRVIVFTGYDDPEVHEYALKLGATEVVQKASDCPVLFETIKRVHSKAAR